MTRIRADQLLVQADHLAGRKSGPGRPRSTDLRRAVSSSYYALFHGLLDAVTTHLLPSGSQSYRDALTRSIQHTSIKKVSAWIESGNTPPAGLEQIVGVLESAAGITDLAYYYLQLLQARHEADYDHGSDLFTKPQTIAYVDMAREGIALIRQMRGDPQFELFLALLALRY